MPDQEASFRPGSPPGCVTARRVGPPPRRLTAGPSHFTSLGELLRLTAAAARAVDVTGRVAGVVGRELDVN
jgi:hypothetical protein